MERIRDYVHVAGANLLSTPLRSILSILGIVVGTASVISVLALGAGAREDLLDSVTKLGTEVFRVSAEYDAKMRRTGALDLNDLAAIRAAPFVVHAFVDLQDSEIARSRFATGPSIIVAADVGYLKMRQYRVERGRDFNPVDQEDRRLVCMLNAAKASRLFPAGQNPVGNDVFFFGTKWQVIGTYRNQAPDPPPGQISHAEILIPMTSYVRNVKQQVALREIEVHVRPESAANAPERLAEIVQSGDETRKNLFSVVSDRERLSRRLENRRLLFVLWTAIAFISLLVGGIGMMNVMLTSVAERTREIGLRRAIGARRKDILVQFLVESCILSVIGGILGLFAGAALARALPYVLKDFGIKLAVMEPSFAFLAVGASVALGIVFGLYPAVRAAAFSPAEALRSDG